MRAVLLLLVLGACWGSKATSSGGGGSRTGVMPMLSELPADPARRDAILDSSNQVAGPEHRKGFTKKERKAESAAATAAAILGSAFSKTQNVTIGGAITFDENTIIAPETAPPAPKPMAPTNPDAPKPAVPWIQLKQPAPAPDPAK